MSPLKKRHFCTWWYWMQIIYKFSFQFIFSTHLLHIWSGKEGMFTRELFRKPGPKSNVRAEKLSISVMISYWTLSARVSTNVTDTLFFQTGICIAFWTCRFSRMCVGVSFVWRQYSSFLCFHLILVKLLRMTVDIQNTSHPMLTSSYISW